ncbi:MAG: hypothetical protein U0133_17550 [Gemmatimonadales bacterium]
MRRLCLGILALLLGGSAACGSDDALQVITIIEAPRTVQGGTANFTVNVYPVSGDRVTSIIIVATGAFGIYDSGVITEGGGVTVRRQYAIPLGSPNGIVNLIARARTRDGEVAQDSSVFLIMDDQPPQFILDGITPGAPHPGDSVFMHFEAVDNVRVRYAILRFSGAYTRRDSIFIGAPGGVRSRWYLIPDTVTGTSMQVSAFAIDYLDNPIDSLLATIPIAH